MFVALAGSTLARMRQRIVEGRRSAELLRIWPLRPGRDIDGLTLGVFPARQANGDDGLPTYISRDADSTVDDALRAGGCVLIVGPPRAGKTRTAYEAMRRLLDDSTL